MLTHLKEIIDLASTQSKAAPAFNTMNLEITQAIIAGAKEQPNPVIIQTTENVIKYAGLKTVFGMITSIVEQESGNLPIAIHLDHGKSLEVLKACVDIGYSSVHFDGSELPFEENIKLTKEAVDYAHRQGAWVQGELGNILGKEGLIKFQQEGSLKKYLTDPFKVKEFVKETGIDTIAVSIGNLHGSFVGLENLDLALLEQIRQQINLPIVLHGGSGIDDEQIKQAIALGIRIINIDTELRIAFKQGLVESLAMEKKLVDPRKILAPAKQLVKEKVIEKCLLFSS